MVLRWPGWQQNETWFPDACQVAPYSTLVDVPAHIEHGFASISLVHGHLSHATYFHFFNEKGESFFGKARPKWLALFGQGSCVTRLAAGGAVHCAQHMSFADLHGQKHTPP
jgi:hypothetical protein